MRTPIPSPRCRGITHPLKNLLTWTTHAHPKPKHIAEGDRSEKPGVSGDGGQLPTCFQGSPQYRRTPGKLKSQSNWSRFASWLHKADTATDLNTRRVGEAADWCQVPQPGAPEHHPGTLQLPRSNNSATPTRSVGSSTTLFLRFHPQASGRIPVPQQQPAFPGRKAGLPHQALPPTSALAPCSTRQALWWTLQTIRHLSWGLFADSRL